MMLFFCVSLLSLHSYAKEAVSAVDVDVNRDIEFENLESVTLPDSLVAIGYSAFYERKSLKSIVIPKSVGQISSLAFAECTSLSDIKIGNNVMIISSDTFSGTVFYRDESNWENGVLYLSNYLLSAWDLVSEEYSVRENTRVIGSSAFYNNQNITSLGI